MADAFAPIEALNRSIAVSSTFGHLAPKHRKVYKGTILFTCGEYGDYTCVRSDFGDLPSSPWFHEHIHAFIADHAEERGCLYRFSGTYEMTSKDATAYRFKGRVRLVKLRS